MDPLAKSGQQLFIVPSELELQSVHQQLDKICARHHSSYLVCGIGLIDSLVAASQRIHARRPSQMWLIGIAGSYGDRLRIGQAYEFQRVSCYGIGVGCNELYQSSRELGWPTSESLELECSPTAATSVATAVPLSGLELLSVTAASANPLEAELKLKKFPAAAAEDMEAYSLARLCRENKVPLRVIRGISNRVGDRSANWKIQPAMEAAVDLLEKLLEEQA